jgi:predicted Zn-dependent protease
MLSGWTDSKGRWQAAVGRGFVVINERHNNFYQDGFGSGLTRGALLLHEIGHALGLDHVGSTNELMYPSILRRARSNYKAGDTVGLHKVGKRQGCIPGANDRWAQI